MKEGIQQVLTSVCKARPDNVSSCLQPKNLSLWGSSPFLPPLHSLYGFVLLHNGYLQVVEVTWTNKLSQNPERLTEPIMTLNSDGLLNVPSKCNIMARNREADGAACTLRVGYKDFPEPWVVNCFWPFQLQYSCCWCGFKDQVDVWVAMEKSAWCQCTLLFYEQDTGGNYTWPELEFTSQPISQLRIWWIRGCVPCQCASDPDSNFLIL